MSSFAQRPTLLSLHATPSQALTLLLGPLLLACETGAHMRDGPVPVTQRFAEVSVRLDVPSTGAPALSVLAFRANVTDRSGTDVLGVVDPLVAPLLTALVNCVTWPARPEPFAPRVVR